MIFTTNRSFIIGGVRGEFLAPDCSDFYDNYNGFFDFYLGNEYKRVPSSRVFYYGSVGLLKAFSNKTNYCCVPESGLVNYTMYDAVLYSDYYNFKKPVLFIKNGNIILSSDKLGRNVTILNSTPFEKRGNEFIEMSNVKVMRITRGNNKYKLRGRYKLKDLRW